MFVGIAYVRRDADMCVECTPIKSMPIESMRIAIALERGEPATVPL